jgi:phosphomannomutase
VYEHSSVARDLLRGVLVALGAEVLSLGRADTFVPIDTEAVRPEDVSQARQWAGEYGFDAILSTDGDADRPLIGDEAGNWLRGDVVGILCAQFLAAEVVVTPVSSNTAVEKCGAFRQVLRTRIGSPYVIGGMESATSLDSRQHGNNSPLVVGYEANGGFLLGSDVLRNGVVMSALPTRDALLPMLALLSMARTRECKLSELGPGLPNRFTASDRLQSFPTQNSHALLDRLLAEPAVASELLAPQSGEVVKTDTTDGLRMTFANGDIVHLRPSGNAPELRCYAESESVERATELCQSCLERIRS